MAIHLAFDYSGILKQMLFDNDSDSEDSEKKKRLITHRNFSKKGTSRKPEIIGIIVGTLFVAATTAFAVYSGGADSAQTTLSEFSFSSLAFDAPAEGHGVLYNEPRLPKSFTPIKYILYLYPNISTMTYTGLVKIRVKCNTNTRTVILHSTHHIFDKIAIKTLNVTDIEDIVVTSAKRNLRTEMVILNSSQRLVKNFLYDFYIGFQGNLSGSIVNGMYVSSTKDQDGNTLNTLSAMFLPNLARQVFPCFDEPGYRAEFQLIIQHGRNLSAISNMDIQQVISVGDNLETHFNLSPPLSTYQLSFVLAELSSKQVTTPRGTLVQVFAQRDLINDVDLALSVTPTLITFLEKELNFNYTNRKLDLVCVPRLPMSSFASYGIVQMKEDVLLYDKQTSTMFEQETVTMEIAEVVSAQWFGGITTFDWWDKQWLFGGLAKCMQRFALAKVFNDRSYATLYYDTLYQKPIRNDVSSKPLGAAVVEPRLNEELYEQVNFNDKGSLILSMLSVMTGEKDFLQALTIFLQTQQNTATNIQQFADVFALNSPEYDIVDFTHYWTKQAGFPLVKATNGPLGRQLSIVQSQFTDGTSTEWTLWRFLLLVQYSCAPTMKTYELLSHNDLFPFPRSCANETSPFSSEDWYKVNAGGKGFYRADYSKQDWIAIKKQFDNDFEIFSDKDRANLMDDLFELAKFDYHSIGDALTFTLYLTKERNFLPMQTALKNLNYVVSMATDETVKRCLKEYIVEQIVPTFKYVAAISNKTIEEKHLFHLLVDIVVDKQDELSKKYILEYDIDFLKWILSSERNNLPNYLRDVILKVGIKYGTSYEWDDLERYYMNAKTDAERELIIRTLADEGMYFEEANRTFSTLDFFEYVSYSCANGGQARSIALKMFTDADIYNSMIENPELVKLFFWNCIGKSNTPAQLQEVKNALANVDLQPINSLYIKVIESIQRNINFVRNQDPEVMKWLQQHRSSCLQQTITLN